MKAVSLLLALATSPAQEPQAPGAKVETPANPPLVESPLNPADVRDPAAYQIQARDIRDAKGKTFRGVSAYVPKDANGNRYYYSRSSAGQLGSLGYSETKIESWADKHGRPLAATYTLTNEGYYIRLEMSITRDSIVFDEVVVRQRGKPQETHVVVPIEPGTSIQLSQFHPMDLPLNKEGVAPFTLVDPVGKRADRARLVKLKDDDSAFNLKSDPTYPVYRFRIEGAPVRSEIEIDHQGNFVRTADSKGHVMTVVPLTGAELEELQVVLNRAYRHGEGSEVPTARPNQPITIGG